MDTRSQPKIESLSSWIADPDNEEVLRNAFRWFNPKMVLMWRLGLGRLAGVWPRGFGRILVIEHVGRTSGTVYRTPVNYSIAEPDLYCVAAMGAKTDWYRNVMATPHVKVWLPDRQTAATIEDASDDPDRMAIVRQVLIYSGFAAPVAGLHPTKMTDEALNEATSEYRLIRIRPDLPKHTDPKPNDLVWLSTVAAGVLAGGMLRRGWTRR